VRRWLHFASALPLPNRLEMCTSLSHACLNSPQMSLYTQAPSNPTARALFRASLAYLPLFMAGLVACRVPNTHDADAPARLWAQLRLPAAAAAASATVAESEEDPGVANTRSAPRAGWAPTALAAAPFPFLPLPLRCPHKAYCEEGPPLPPGPPGEA
jgi:hypothetical protein